MFLQVEIFEHIKVVGHLEEKEVRKKGVTRLFRERERERAYLWWKVNVHGSIRGPVSHGKDTDIHLHDGGRHLL